VPLQAAEKGKGSGKPDVLARRVEGKKAQVARAKLQVRR